ncbi:MerR family transcriptional regulator [Telluria mixta]|uniref:MerR family transcriptional regulator n=1 Tax=Telluria mixta TaxID=34071 RepID=UPI00353134A3
MSKLLFIDAAAKTLGVSTSTLRRWEATGRFVPLRTVAYTRIDGVRRVGQEARC